MIVFKQKIYIAPLIAALGKDLAVQGAVSLGTTALSNKAMAKQNEEQMQEQRRLQKQQIKAQAQQNQKMMNTLKQVAQTNPTVAGAAAGQMMQQQFAIPASMLNHLKTVKGAAKDIATVSKQMGIGNSVARGVALGATAAGAGYLVDKAIQADAKRSGIDLGPTEDTRKDHRKKLAKAAGAVAATGLAIAGAKKGYLGNSLKTTTNKYINKTNLRKAGNTMKNAFKEQFVDTKAWDSAKGFKEKASAVNVGGLAITGAFAAAPAISYLGTKKAIKDQARQSGQATEERAYSVNIKSNTIKNFIKNVPRRAKDFFQNKFRPAVQKSTLPKQNVSNKPVASFKEAPVRSILGGISSFWGGGGQQGTAEFTSRLTAQGAKSGNKLTQGAAKFLDNHKTLAVGGSIAVGSMLMKPWEIGGNAVKNSLGAVDKNAMRYEKSQNRQVGEE